MANYNKEGYSVDEIAQILHCNRVTVIHYIDNGELQANVSPKEKVPGKKRHIRILRQHVVEFMERNRTRFDAETLKTWGVGAGYKPNPKPVTPEIHEAYAASTLSELKGAWAGLADAEPEPCEAKIEIPSFSISIDGRIAIGNVASETASKIIDAILNDSQISYSELTIRKGVCYK